MTKTLGVRELSGMTAADWEAAKPDEIFKATNAVSPEFAWFYAEEAFLTGSAYSTFDITFSRQETRDIARTMKFHKMDAAGAGLEILAIESHAASVTVAQVRYPASSAVELAIALTKAAFGKISPEMDDKLRTELMAIVAP
jgi:hypothetical protein